MIINNTWCLVRVQSILALSFHARFGLKHTGQILNISIRFIQTYIDFLSTSFLGLGDSKVNIYNEISKFVFYSITMISL